MLPWPVSVSRAGFAWRRRFCWTLQQGRVLPTEPSVCKSCHSPFEGPQVRWSLSSACGEVLSSPELRGACDPGASWGADHTKWGSLHVLESELSSPPLPSPLHTPTHTHVYTHTHQTKKGVVEWCCLHISVSERALKDADTLTTPLDVCLRARGLALSLDFSSTGWI